MGKVTVNSHLGAGLYDVHVDIGTVQRDKRVAEIDARIAEIDAELAESEPARNDAQAALDAALSSMNNAIDAFIAAPVEANEAARANVVATTATATRAKADLQIAEIGVDELELEKSAINLEKTGINSLVLEYDQDAWCCDLTLSATGDVASVEIPGENDVLMVAPGASLPIADDGHIEARDIQEGHQCYYNAAILPGWQKFMPTYRLGEITGFNTDSTCTVALDNAASSANNLDINQESILLNVPFEYMDCNRNAFENNDRVIVRFDGQDWDSPKVVGFESNPKGCSSYIIRPADLANPDDDVVMVYPSGVGSEPSIASGDDVPAIIIGRSFGSRSKFSHDTKPYRVSSTRNVPYIKGKALLFEDEIKAVFTVSGGRCVVIAGNSSNALIYSTGLSGDTQAAYDSELNPDGLIQIGSVRYSQYVYIRPDGGKIYGFNDDGHCSVHINSDGFGALNGVIKSHDIMSPDITIEETGITPNDGVETSGVQNYSNTTTKSYTGPIGVFWTGSPGSWSETIVSATSDSSITLTHVVTWAVGSSAAVFTGTRVTASSRTETLDIDAGGAYSKRITDRSSSTDVTTSFEDIPGWSSGFYPEGDDYNRTGTATHSSVMPRILGGKDYIEEVNNVTYTITETITRSVPGPKYFNYNNSISFGGNTAKHNGATIKTGETVTSSASVSGIVGTTSKPTPIIQYGNWYLFTDEGDYSTALEYGFGVMEIVLRNSHDDRIAETATDFMIASFSTISEVELNDTTEGYNGSVGPYLSTYGYLDSLLGLSSISADLPTGSFATIY